jgi:two-component system phosphate regulon sensor histidine kinase PhoR
MRKAILLRFLILSVIGITICGMVSAVILSINEENKTKDWLSKLTIAVANNYIINDDAQYLSQLAGNNRVTIIAPNGEVIADSAADISLMENHLNREEVINAKNDVVYITLRTSETLAENFMYASIKMNDGNIIRIAQKYGGILDNFIALLPAILAAIFVALLLSFFISLEFSKTLTIPLEKVVDCLSSGSFAKLSVHQSNYYELDKIILNIRNLFTKLNDSKNELAAERGKLNYILSNMAEGFILLDENKNIVLCNNSAKVFLNNHYDVERQNVLVLTREIKFIAAIDKALDNGQSAYFDMLTHDKRVVGVYISPIMNDYLSLNGRGVTILLIDITMERQLQKQRQEFFSNASHELKTPITSIRGFAELLNKGIVQDEEKRKELFARMEAEAERMTILINDILMISKLETKNSQADYKNVDFKTVIIEAIETLRPQAQLSEIEIVTKCEKVILWANKRHLYDLAVNLIENAVKYNKKGGTVKVNLTKSAKQAIFTVADTGIGIPKANQSRIFERFYRVDSGRNKEIAGTGLGLSIVKHIVTNYEGTLELSSSPNQGTKIRILLPIINKK